MPVIHKYRGQSDYYVYTLIGNNMNNFELVTWLVIR